MTRNLKCFCGSNKKHKKCHSDINYYSDMAQYIKKLNLIEAEFNNVSKNNLPCKKGCYECCDAFIPVSLIELSYMLYGFLKLNSIDKLEHILNFNNFIWENYKSNNKQSSENIINDFLDVKEKDFELCMKESIYNFKTFMNKKSKYKCPFLKNEICSIYEYRPIICRIKGHIFESQNEQIKICNSISIRDLKQFMNEIDIRKFVKSNFIQEYKLDKYNINVVNKPFPLAYLLYRINISEIEILIKEKSIKNSFVKF